MIKTDSPPVLAHFSRVLEVTRALIGTATRFLTRRIRKRPHHGPELLKGLCESLGGSFLKLGQILSLQIDTLPREYRDALRDLLDRVPHFQADHVERIFVETLRASPR